MKKTLLFLSVIGLLITSCEKGIFGNKIVDSDGNEYKTVTNPTTGKKWLDRNLGASQVATSSTDGLAFGGRYQWGRGADGHQLKNSSTKITISSTDNPGHGDFIIPENYDEDWRMSRNDSLWQGVNGTNNPCPDGYRLPTKSEWEEEIATWVSDDAAGAFASPLKLTMAGYRDYERSSYNLGSLLSVGTRGKYWSSTVDEYLLCSRMFFSMTSANGAGRDWRAYGLSVRCIKD